jgi:hypothetical protein
MNGTGTTPAVHPKGRSASSRAAFGCWVAPTADGKARKKPTRKPVASGNDADAAAGGIDLDAYVAPPEEVRKNILNALEEHGEIARVFRKWVKLSHFDDAVRAEIDAAIDGVIQRWNRVRSTLRKRSPVFEPRPEEGNDVDPVAAAEDRKAAFAELETTVEAADVTPQTMMARDHGLDCGPMPDCLRRAP